MRKVRPRLHKEWNRNGIRTTRCAAGEVLVRRGFDIVIHHYLNCPFNITLNQQVLNCFKWKYFEFSKSFLKVPVYALFYWEF
jgi:hypothetical protein